MCVEVPAPNTREWDRRGTRPSQERSCYVKSSGGALIPCPYEKRWHRGRTEDREGQPQPGGHQAATKPGETRPERALPGPVCASAKPASRPQPVALITAATGTGVSSGHQVGDEWGAWWPHTAGLPPTHIPGETTGSRDTTGIFMLRRQGQAQWTPPHPCGAPGTSRPRQPPSFCSVGHRRVVRVAHRGCPSPPDMGKGSQELPLCSELGVCSAPVT